MNRKLCLLFLVCLAVVLVKSETSIEVDENGDEYEVKRFNIQGRNLNEGRSQCVVSRRKRATTAAVRHAMSEEEPTENDGEQADNEMPKPEKLAQSEEETAGTDDDEDEEDDVMAKGEVPHAMLFYSPPVLNYGGNADDDADDNDDDEDDDEDVNNMNKTDDINQVIGHIYDVDDDEDDEEDAADTIELVQLPQLPVLGQLQSEGQSVAAIASGGGGYVHTSHIGGGVGGGYVHTGHIGGGAGGGYVQTGHVTHGSKTGGANAITVVQSHAPPKVNPQTHAVFELLPVNHASDQDGDDGEDDYEGGDENLDFEEDISPVTTTAIWSTGDDEHYDDFDKKPAKPNKVVKKKKMNKKPINKPMRTKKRPTRRPLKPIRKNKNRITNNNKRITANRKRISNNKKRPNRNNIRRPIKKRKTNKLRKGNKTQRRRPVNLNSQRRGQQTLVKKTRPQADNDADDNEQDDKIKDYNRTENNNRNQNSNANRKLMAKKRKQNQHKIDIDQGSNTFTKTVTMTETGGAEDDGDVNCIIIRKDPPPPPPATTARPFWNILGRSANPAAASQYGRRKRINFRVIA